MNIWTLFTTLYYNYYQNIYFFILNVKCLFLLFIKVEDFVKDGGDCSFLHDHYHKLESRLCKETLPAMLYVGLLMFINGILGIVMVANGLIINKRYGGHGKKEGDDDKQVEDAASGFGK